MSKAMWRLATGVVVSGLVMACGSVAAAPSASVSSRWSKANCQWAVEVLVWDAQLDAQSAQMFTSRGEADLAGFYAQASDHWSRASQTAWTHCGRDGTGYVEPTPTDSTAIGWFDDARKAHLAALARGSDIAWNRQWASYYASLASLFRAGRCTTGPHDCSFFIQVQIPASPGPV